MYPGRGGVYLLVRLALLLPVAGDLLEQVVQLLHQLQVAECQLVGGDPEHLPERRKSPAGAETQALRAGPPLPPPGTSHHPGMGNWVCRQWEASGPMGTPQWPALSGSKGTPPCQDCGVDGGIGRYRGALSSLQGPCGWRGAFQQQEVHTATGLRHAGPAPRALPRSPELRAIGGHLGQLGHGLAIGLLHGGPGSRERERGEGA